MNKKELDRELEDYKQKLYQSENTCSEMQRKVFSVQSESEKEKALLEQKNEFLEKTIQDYQKKENEYSSDFKTQKKDYQTTIRDMQVKYETQIKSLSQKLEEANERLLEV